MLKYEGLDCKIPRDLATCDFSTKILGHQNTEQVILRELEVLLMMAFLG